VKPKKSPYKPREGGLDGLNFLAMLLCGKLIHLRSGFSAGQIALQVGYDAQRKHASARMINAL
jgi:hypothetical protein